MAASNAKSFFLKLGDVTWVTSKENTGQYEEMMEKKFDNIDEKNYTHVGVRAMHRMDPVLRALCKGESHNPLIK